MTKEYSVPPAEDSSPTPVIELGYKDIPQKCIDEGKWDEFLDQELDLLFTS